LFWDCGVDYWYECREHLVLLIKYFSMTITLEAEPRVVKRSVVKHLRNAGRVPAIVYGAIATPITISVDGHEFKRVLKEAGESTIVELLVNGTKMPTLVHALSHSTLNHHFEHIDFLVVDVKQKIEVDVPLVFTGEAPAEKVGVITKVMHDIHVEALPADLPHDITVDLSSLVDLESTIRIKDLLKTKGVKYLHDPEDVVVAVTEQAKEEEEEVAQQVQTEPELVNGKKNEVSTEA